MKKIVLATCLALIVALPNLAMAETHSKVVKCVRMVHEDCGQASGGGAVLGGGAGAVTARVLLGSNPIGWVVGAAIGAGAGHQAEKNLNCTRTSYWVITLANGQQFENDRPMRIGQRVTLD